MLKIPLSIILIALFAFLGMHLPASPWNPKKNIEKSDSLRKVFQGWTKLYPTEKACLITDKPLYAPGETIWFSVFLSPSRPDIPVLSEIAYAELINPKGSIEKKIHPDCPERNCQRRLRPPFRCPGWHLQSKSLYLMDGAAG